MSSEIELILSYIREQCQEEFCKLTPLNGDASTRRYFRAETKSKTYIVCIEDPNGQQSTDFIRMSELLADKIKIPTITYSNLDISIIIQEDVGSNSLNLFLAKNPKKRVSYLKRAIEDLNSYHQIETDEFLENFDRSFDREKLSFEFDLSVNFFLSEYLDTDISLHQKELNKTKEFLINYFEERKEVVCHRDYHGRNLFVLNDEIRHIDYQDARLGPRVYDLCSLIDDSYFRLKENEKSMLKEYFYSENSCHYSSYEEFEKEYNIVAIQRIFKALGSFTYLTIDKKKKGYERYISNAMENLREYLEEVDELSSFKEILIEEYYEN